MIGGSADSATKAFDNITLETRDLCHSVGLDRRRIECTKNVDRVVFPHPIFCQGVAIAKTRCEVMRTDCDLQRSHLDKDSGNSNKIRCCTTVPHCVTRLSATYHRCRVEGEYPTGACVDVGGEGEWDRLFVGWPVVRHDTGDTRHSNPCLLVQVFLRSLGFLFRLEKRCELFGVP